MSPYLPAEPNSPFSLHEDDIAGISALYGEMFTVGIAYSENQQMYQSSTVSAQIIGRNSIQRESTNVYRGNSMYGISSLYGAYTQIEIFSKFY